MKYTSLELSKWLQEKGFKGEHEFVRILKEGTLKGECCKVEILVRREYVWKHYKIICKYPAYDILNDLCVKYAKELFGEDNYCIECDKKEEICTCEPDAYRIQANYLYHPQLVIFFLQQGKQEEAEAYIMKHSVLNNPKEK